MIISLSNTKVGMVVTPISKAVKHLGVPKYANRHHAHHHLDMHHQHDADDHCNLFSRAARRVIASVSEAVEHLRVPGGADHQVAQRSLGDVARIAKPERKEILVKVVKFIEGE